MVIVIVSVMDRLGLSDEEISARKVEDDKDKSLQRNDSVGLAACNPMGHHWASLSVKHKQHKQQSPVCWLQVLDMQL